MYEKVKNYSFEFWWANGGHFTALDVCLGFLGLLFFEKQGGFYNIIIF